MLGINSKRTLISGKFADEIRRKMDRIQSGRLNKDDLNEILKKRSRRSENKYTLVWK